MDALNLPYPQVLNPLTSHVSLQPSSSMFMSQTSIPTHWQASIVTALGWQLLVQTGKSFQCQKWGPYKTRGLFYQPVCTTVVREMGYSVPTQSCCFLPSDAPTYLPVLHFCLVIHSSYLWRTLPEVTSQDESSMLSTDGFVSRMKGVENKPKAARWLVSDMKWKDVQNKTNSIIVTISNIAILYSIL